MNWKKSQMEHLPHRAIHSPYRSSTAGLNNVAESKITTQYGKEGTVTQEFSTETEQEKTFTYDLNASFTAYGLVFGVKAGGGAGTTYSESAVYD